ncbi:VWA domain-containing protein [Sulfobacillus thermosulfidooxidans]|uniref:VWA domain-containing protein n=1 Tax=Sulfobacillus thermosulfidooxidans TaxID=28034 RepID=UPI0006B664ED|nr:VWA domain-containing protein [Sulfobacillus thermosulfidooxidans]
MTALSHNLWALARGLRRLGFSINVTDLKDVEIALSVTQDFSVRGLHDIIENLWVKSLWQKQVFDQAYTLWVHALLDNLPIAGNLPGISPLPKALPQSKQVTWMSQQIARVRVMAPETVNLHIHTASDTERLYGKEPPTAHDVWNLRHQFLKMPHHNRHGYRKVSAKRGRAWDLSKTLRKSLTSGELMQWFYHTNRPKRRKTVVLWDLSQSMAPFIPVFFPFLYGLIHSSELIEIWGFSTRLTLVNPLLQGETVNNAYRALFRRVPDLGGGTRLEESLLALTMKIKPYLRHHTDLILITDGYEAGECVHLESLIARLKRLTHLLIWWNPWLADPHYEIVSHAGRILQQYCRLERAGSLGDCFIAWNRLA